MATQHAPARDLAELTVVITGASSGMGRGTALKLAARCARVVIAARRADLLEEVATEARASGGEAVVVPADVSNPADIHRLLQAALEPNGRIDVWLNNVGIGALGRFWDIPVEDHARVVDVNLNGVIYGSHAAINQFRKQGRGTLVNIGSIDSEVPLAYQAGYSASKAGVLALGRALNEELRLDKQDHIKVATVMPWAVDTPWWDHAANYSGGVPRMAAMDDPDEVCDAIVELCLDPHEELAVGWKAKASYASHKVTPNMAERMSANVSHKWQIEDAPPAGVTTGTLYEPMMSGRGVGGGVCDRMEREESRRSD